MFAVIAACSTQQLAVNAISSALAGDGGSVFTSDEDPELVRDALPFGLKTYEALLETAPTHRDLLLASAQGFAAYAFLLQQQADVDDALGYRAARAQRARASKLYLRARDYALRGLALNNPGIQAIVDGNDVAMVNRVSLIDIDFLYWAGASWAGAINLDRNSQALLAGLPNAAALVQRVIELDEAYGDGSAQEFFISYEAAQGNSDPAALKGYFEKALLYSQGKRASTYLAFAESSAQPNQNLRQFTELLDQALNVDVDADPNNRLLNIVAQRRAQWLRGRLGDLFLDAE